MPEPACCQKVRNELGFVRMELEELLEALSDADRAPRAPEEGVLSGEPDRENFFDQIMRREESPDRERVYREAVLLIAELGYASTLVLQQRLELNYRQATAMLAALERDGMVGPAHGFRPHKALPAAFELRDSICV